MAVIELETPEAPASSPVAPVPASAGQGLIVGHAIKRGNLVLVIEAEVARDPSGLLYRVWDTGCGEARLLLMPYDADARPAEGVTPLARVPMVDGQIDGFLLTPGIEVARPLALLTVPITTDPILDLAPGLRQRFVHWLSAVVAIGLTLGVMTIGAEFESNIWFSRPGDPDDFLVVWALPLLFQWVAAPLWLAALLILPWLASLPDAARFLADLPRLILAVIAGAALFGGLAIINFLIANPMMTSGRFDESEISALLIGCSVLNWAVLGLVTPRLFKFFNWRLVGDGDAWRFRPARDRLRRVRLILRASAAGGFLLHQAAAVSFPIAVQSLPLVPMTLIATAICLAVASGLMHPTFRHLNAALSPPRLGRDREPASLSP